jgi:hypothetical protein
VRIKGRRFFVKETRRPFLSLLGIAWSLKLTTEAQRDAEEENSRFENSNLKSVISVFLCSLGIQRKAASVPAF